MAALVGVDVREPGRQIAIGILEAAAGELVIVVIVDHDVGETIH